MSRSMHSLRSLLGLLTLTLALASPGSVAAETIRLDADFDQGSLAVDDSTIDGEEVALVGRDNYYPGRWKWLYFAANGVAGWQPTFRIDDNFALGGDDLDGHQMVYSYDQRTWHYFDQNRWLPDAQVFEFSNDRPFDAAKVHIAFGVPYPYERVVSHTERISASPWVRPTPSGDGSLALGESPRVRDDLGRRIPPRKLFAYEIGDFDAAELTRKVVLVSGIHANESPGNFVLEGLVDFLVSDDPAAAELRRATRFFVYPMVNPDGRYAGYNRGVVQPDVYGPNRHWTPPNYGGLHNLRIVGEAMRADAAPADAVIDFHADAGGKSGHYAFVLPRWQVHPLWMRYRELEPTVEAKNAKLINHTMARFGRVELGADFSITFEAQFLPGDDVARYHELGAHWGQALHDAFLPSPYPADSPADSPVD